nr:hypothetical protein [Tanacetum cinerariifolium]
MPVKAISLPQDVLSTSDCHLIELENQVQCLMEAHLAPTQPTQVNKISTSYKAKEEGNVKTSTTEYEDHEMTIESKKEFEEETEDEIEEEKEDSPKHFDTFPTIKELSGEGLILYQAYGNLYAMTVAGDGITCIKRRRRGVSSDGVRNFAMASGRGRLKEDLESSTWRRRQ